MKYHVEAILHNDELRFFMSDNIGKPPDPSTLIRFCAPNKRLAIYAAEDETFDREPETYWKDYQVIQRGPWAELYPLFEAYARML